MSAKVIPSMWPALSTRQHSARYPGAAA
jgi:hypothetical protein